MGVTFQLGWKLFSCRHGQKLGQLADLASDWLSCAARSQPVLAADWLFILLQSIRSQSVLTSDWLFTLVQPIRSKLTCCLTLDMTRTHKFPPHEPGQIFDSNL